MKKNLIKLGALAVLCLPGVSSCKPDGPKSSTSTVGADTSCRNAPQGTTTITFWHALKNVNQKAIYDLTNKFNEAHRGDICVEMAAQDNYDTIFKNMTSAIQSDMTLPDLVTTYPDHVALYQEGNNVIDMTSFANDDQIGFPSNEEDPKNSWEDFLESYRKESVNYRFNATDVAATNGKMYSLPLNKSTEIMYYNKTFFDYWTGKDTVKMANGDTISKIRTAAGQPMFGDTLDANTKKLGDTKPDGGTYTEEEAQAWNRSGYGPHVKYNNEWKTPVEHGMKNPADIVKDDPSTWWTWEDVEKTGEILQEITKSKYDLTEATLRKYNECNLPTPPSNTDPIDIKKNGNVVLNYDSTGNLFVTLANQVDSYVSLDKDAKPTLKFDSEEALIQYDNIEDLYDRGIFTIPGAIGNGTLQYGTDAFTSKYLFLSVGSVAGAALSSAGAFETGTAPIPQVSLSNPKVIQQGTNITMTSAQTKTADTITATGTNDGSKKARKTWEYVKFLTSYDSNLFFATNTSYMPCRSSVINSEEYQEHLSAGTAERNAMKTSIAVSTTNSFFTDSPFNGSGSLRSDAEKVIKTGLTGSSTSMRQEIQKYATEKRGQIK